MQEHRCIIVCLYLLNSKKVFERRAVRIQIQGSSSALRQTLYALLHFVLVLETAVLLDLNLQEKFCSASAYVGATAPLLQRSNHDDEAASDCE